MSAFRLAAELGADGVELDVQLCKDGEAVVIHNFTVDRTTNGRGRVRDLTLAELLRLDAGNWYAPEFAGERIPTLAQVLHELGPRLFLNIELKVTTRFSGALAAEVVRLIEDSQMAHRVVVSSFDPLVLWRVRRLNRSIPLGLLVAPDQPLYLRNRWLQPLVRPQFLHPRWDTVSQESLAAARRQGLRVSPWTCNDPVALRRLINWGVHAIITDQPDLLADIMTGAAQRE